MKTRKIVVSIVAVIALVAMLSVCLVACNAENYVKKLEDAGYMAGDMTEDEIAEYFGEEAAESGKIEWAVMGVKIALVGSDFVAVVKLADEQDAKDLEASLGGDSEYVARVGKIVMMAMTEEGLAVVK